MFIFEGIPIHFIFKYVIPLLKIQQSGPFKIDLQH